MLITKANGEKVQFNKSEYQASLQRVGLSISETKDICNQIYQDLYPEISSRNIYLKTQKILKQKSNVFSARYSLKKAIMNLGPTGFFFERYMASVLNSYGYKTKYDQILKGKCTNHEVDIVAEKDGQKFMIECKYHNQPGLRSDLHVALYTYARFLDLKDIHKFTTPFLITNTLCTSQAIGYAGCVGLKIIGWHYPMGEESLEYYIESKKLYPVTVLTSMNHSLSEKCRQENLVLIQDLLKFTPTALAEKLMIKPALASGLINQANALTR